MSGRRFTDKPNLNPEAVRPLPDDHPALAENRTLFPTTVVEVTEGEPDRILVSGLNNRKIGETVEKGAFKGYAIYTLTLEERATCPEDCEARAYCYGNGMQLARRHKIGDTDTFFDRLGLEIAELSEKHDGVLIRLHVLGDFPSVEYVAFWKEVLDEYANVACFGYTHRSPTNWGGDEIGDSIQAVKDAYPDRFRIRWSSPVSRDDGAIVIDFVPQKPRTTNGEIVCPSQTDATACCATCALCWEQRDPIAFIKHGPKSSEIEARGVMNASAKAYWAEKDAARRPAHTRKLSEPLDGGSDDPQSLVVAEPAANVTEEDAPQDVVVWGDGERRRVRGIQIPHRDKLPQKLPNPPEHRMVEPSTLIIEDKYQRQLSGKSLRLIRSIVTKWDWAKFKPPVCAIGPNGLYVIDGQHTAIAAASHPAIKEIPVMVVFRNEISARAAAFVSQNRDRLAMSPLQIFHAELAAQDKDALGILRCVIKAGASVPRSTPAKGKEKPGEIVSMSALRYLWAGGDVALMERVIRIAVMSGQAPINSLLLRGIACALKMEPTSEDLNLTLVTDPEIAWHVGQIADIEKQAEEIALEAECNKYDALGLAIESRVWDRSEEYEAYLKAGQNLALAS